MIICSVCGNGCVPLDTLDFNRCCDERRSAALAASELTVEYWFCEHCGFCFAPMFSAWRDEDFARHIYNADYPLVDPDYLCARPLANAQLLNEQFGNFKGMIRHLDYGGGNGALSRKLNEDGWNSCSYDPFGAGDAPQGRYNLITVFEVFEHVSQIVELVETLGVWLDDPGMIFFSTLTSDQDVAPGKKLDWWYAAPRNGHISLFSTRSLELLGFSAGLQCCSFSQNLHAYWRLLPVWASHLFEW